MRAQLGHHRADARQVVDAQRDLARGERTELGREGGEVVDDGLALRLQLRHQGEAVDGG